VRNSERRRISKSLIYSAATVALMLTLGSGCGGAGPEAGNRQSGNAGTTPAPVPTPDNTGNVVEVRLTEFRIEMPTSIAAGPTTFKVANAGSVEHSFEVAGNNIERKLEANLKAGSTATLTLDLRPGLYNVSCPVSDHEGRGMFLELLVR
jgi:uncharacterized cupredoxin-like copper-binding protein